MHELVPAPLVDRTVWYAAGLKACVNRFCEKPEEVLTENNEVINAESAMAENSAGNGMHHKCAKCGVHLVEDGSDENRCSSSRRFVCQTCRDEMGMI